MSTIIALQRHLALCEERAAGPLPIRPNHPIAYICPFTRDEWINEALLAWEQMAAWENAEAA